jgi:hypothetical protein
LTPGSQLPVNTLDYTAVELLFFAAGGLGWALAYLGVLREIVRNRYVEIPAAAVCANIAWELNWGILHRTDLGWVFAWGYRVWFFLDVFIVIGLLRYGTRHLATPRLARVFRGTALAGIAGFSAVIFLLVESGADTSNGLVSGYMVTLMMSALYIPQYFRETDRRNYSAFVAWCKLLGNGLVIGFCALAMPENRFLLTLCVVTAVLDVYYVLLFHTRRTAAPAAA